MFKLYVDKTGRPRSNLMPGIRVLSHLPRGVSNVLYVCPPKVIIFFENATPLLGPGRLT